VGAAVMAACPQPVKNKTAVNRRKESGLIFILI
jgi:hypothetical protein